MKKLKATLLILLITSFCHAQSQRGSGSGCGLSVSIYQDARLMFLGDQDHNIDKGTLDLVLRVKMEGYQDRYGYFVVYPEFEYAEIEGIYKRYSVNVGYVLNQLPVKDFELGFGIGWGWIDRYGKSMFSFAGTSNLSYKITDNIKLSLLGQITERKDLAVMWGNKGLNFKEDGILRFSGMIGLEYKFK